MAYDEKEENDGFSPDENPSGAEEFNPYADFIENDESLSPRDDDSEKITTEDDINLPDFLKGDKVENINGFAKGISSNPMRNENFVSQDANPDDKSEKKENSPNLSESDFSGSKTEALNETAWNAENDVASTANANTSEKNNEQGGNTFDKEEDMRFKAKVSAEEANTHTGGKPRILNKKFLLTVIVCVLGTVMLITFLMPTKKKKDSKNEKPVAETHRSTDYASIAKRPPLPDEQDAGESDHYGNIKETQKEEEVEIPPIVTDTKPAYNEQNIKYNTGRGSGSSSTLEIPDTRNDSLHGKSISGIKGLTSTQQSYSTDYQQTIAKNTRSVPASSGYSLPSKEEYMKNVLSAYSSAYGNATSGNNSYAAQNNQSEKNSFFNNGRQSDAVGQGEWLNLNTLWQGSIFEAVLTSELNTDLPGEITARISKNIYSSQDGRYLLIPQNSILYGTYNSSISYSQKRVQVGWNTLIRPDGYKIQLGNMNGTDAKGASGLKGIVNDHPMAYLKAIGLMSVFSIVNSEFQASMGNSQNQYVQNVIANTQQVTNNLADKLIDRAMNVQPTIKIKSGTKINIVVNQNLSLPPVENIQVTQPYHRFK
ncbi:TrbI/VirB10 family protein [Treponema pectinovorum]|uniref:TrbI/VirB10 family protein n=1 Tax=Treponema pectinovorum TaxID=164 RepID=UPI0011F0D2E0|nr:TrbI/VirB10 family protein [Treponema pectinovorum]